MHASASWRAACAVALITFGPGAPTPAETRPALPSDMQAVRTHGTGGPEVLKLERVPLPEIGDGQVLLRVRAAGVNPVDWKIRERGRRSASEPWIPGFDAAGVIAKVGPGVTNWKVGDEVFALLSPSGGGGYAEYARVNSRDVARKPRDMEFEEAAGIPTVGVTVYGYLVETTPLKGKRVLIHGAAGGVGSAAVQIAKAHGAHVIATASARNHDYLRSIGVDQAIDYRTTKFEDAARDVDIVFDTVGGETLERSYDVLRRGGTLISIVERVSAERCAQRGLTCPAEAESEGAGEALDSIRQLAEAGKFRMNVDRAFPLAEAAQAQELNREGRTRGKIVLRMGD